MRIAQVATSSGPVREDRTGSVESIVWLLSRELAAMGHQITVFGCGGSESPGDLVITHPASYGETGTPADWQLCDWMTLCRAVEQSDRFDMIHSHAYLWGLPLGPISTAPIVHTMHTCPYGDEGLLRERFLEAVVVAVSASQWRAASLRPPAAVIHHGVDPGRFTFRGQPDDYLCYLGRFIPGKGPLEAIAAAQELRLPLILAGPANDYFQTEIRPHVDGTRVRYAGAVDREGRNSLLGGARALLYPLREPEPFGLVQIEAMMCGTPVAAIAMGAVPEIVDDGVTGILAEQSTNLAASAAAAVLLDRHRVRAIAESRFSARRMAEQYGALFEDVMARSAVDHGRSPSSAVG